MHAGTKAPGLGGHKAGAQGHQGWALPPWSPSQVTSFWGSRGPDMGCAGCPFPLAKVDPQGQSRWPGHTGRPWAWPASLATGKGPSTPPVPVLQHQPLPPPAPRQHGGAGQLQTLGWTDPVRCGLGSHPGEVWAGLDGSRLMASTTSCCHTVSPSGSAQSVSRVPAGLPVAGEREPLWGDGTAQLGHAPRVVGAVGPPSVCLHSGFYDWVG